MATYPRLIPDSENHLAPAPWAVTDELTFAYWVPNISGGLVVTTLPMDTDWTPEANIKYARDAERNGFELALSQTRWFASYGADHQHEAFVISSAILSHTEKIHLITAVLPGMFHPAVCAKMQASLDVVSKGRTAVNVVSGWFKGEYTGYGMPWLEHAERYRRSEEFIRIMKGMWTEDEFTFYGDFYQINGAPMLPKPAHRIPVFQGGNSVDAQKMAGRVTDVMFMNGNTNAGFKKIMDGCKASAVAAGRNPNELMYGANGFCIVRDSMEEATETLRDIIVNADVEAVKGFGEAVKQAGRSSREGEGMWANSSFEDLVQYNDGFKTGLIGTPESVADRLMELKGLGLKVALCGFLHYNTDLAEFGKKVIPLVREREEALKKPSRGKAKAA